MADADSPAPPERSPDGVDLTLIRWALSLTPAERLAAHDAYLNEIEELRERNRATPQHSNP